jgi:hypothetical protein
MRIHWGNLLFLLFLVLVGYAISFALPYYRQVFVVVFGAISGVVLSTGLK